MALNIVVLGSGIAGLSSALALSKNLPSPTPSITIYEVRDALSDIGGAVNLTPKALRYLDHLGVLDILHAKGLGAECKTIEIYDLYSGNKYAEVDFRGPYGNGIGKPGSKEYLAMRVMRCDLQAALLEAVKKQNGTRVVFGKKILRIEEREGAQAVQLTFQDGESTISDLLLGCDGIHSAARKLSVESDRTPKYTGITVVMSFPTLGPNVHLRWKTTALASSRRGSFMMSYYEQSRTKQYTTAVMETAEVANREGWKVKGSDQKAIKADILDRFSCHAMPELEELIGSSGDWTMYPVYALAPKGKWISEGSRVVLIGGSAHAVSTCMLPSRNIS